jgi:hypothetical protein
MKIYIQNSDINLDILCDNIKYINNYKLIYSNDGIFKIFKDTIHKINIIDKPIISFSINGNTLLIDKSIINIENDITTIPIKHKIIEIDEIKYKLTNELSLVLLYNNNSLFDNYFISNIIDNNIKNTLLKYIK